MDAGPEAERGPAWGGCRPGGRLDMSHGFVQHIRRNQIARDDYDREVKQAKEKVKKRHTPTPPRPRKPDQRVYHPCRRSRVDPACGLEYEGSSESSSSTEPDPRSTELFCLEYEADSGEVTSVIVHQDDSPEEVTEKVCAQSPLEPPLHEALRQRVQEELRKRRAKR
ncbi:UPF0561 protein C2orf68 homolog isoform X2 [Natator depressus]|uniref:UPF0561 protein C2orf68 homolog isoform X2 n=1 Tax=Natator depressus TaxID=27790 RepID=UPI003EB6A0E6